MLHKDDWGRVRPQREKPWPGARLLAPNYDRGLIPLIVLSFIYLFNLIFILPFVFVFFFYNSGAEFRLFRPKPLGLWCFIFASLYFPFLRSPFVLFNLISDDINIDNLSKISIKFSEDLFLRVHLKER